MEKHYNNSQCFKEKKYKVKFLISSILKKIDTDNLKKKKQNKHQKKGKKSCWEYYNNSQCFVMKATVIPHII